MAKNKYYPEEVLVEKVQKGEYGWLDYVNLYSEEWQEVSLKTREKNGDKKTIESKADGLVPRVA